MAPKYSNKLEGKRVLVIGGTSGIGFCVAEACVEFGAFVTVASSSQVKVDKTIERLTTSYPEAKDRIGGIVCDLASPDVEENLKAMFEFATKDGKLDHVVNTAGDRFGLVKVSEVTSVQIVDHAKVRLIAGLLLAKSCPLYMHQSSSSSITFTGGVVSTKPRPGWSVAASWGGAKEGMTRGLAVDLKPVRVNCISPGAIETELWDGFQEFSRETMKKAFVGRSLTGKVGTPEDMAEAYLYFMRDAFATGTVLLSDGGYILV